MRKWSGPADKKRLVGVCLGIRKPIRIRNDSRRTAFLSFRLDALHLLPCYRLIANWRCPVSRDVWQESCCNVTQVRVSVNMSMSMHNGLTGFMPGWSAPSPHNAFHIRWAAALVDVDVLRVRTMPSWFRNWVRNPLTYMFKAGGPHAHIDMSKIYRMIINH